MRSLLVLRAQGQVLYLLISTPLCPQEVESGSFRRLNVWQYCWVITEVVRDVAGSALLFPERDYRLFSFEM